MSRLVWIGPRPRIALAYEGRGPLVLFLHGIGGNRRNWDGQLEAVAAAGFRAAAWDARGYGDSDDYDGALNFADFAADLGRVLDHFDVPAAHLVGLSMGGLIAQDFYRRHPARVLTLTLADTRNVVQRHANSDFLRTRQAPLLAGKTPAEIAPALAKTIVGPKASPAALARLVESLSALRTESYLKAITATTLMGETAPFDALGAVVDLATVAVPTLVICGADDTVTPLQMSEQIARGIPGARLAVIPDAGHLTNIEAPDAFNAALLGFLTGAAEGADRSAQHTLGMARRRQVMGTEYVDRAVTRVTPFTADFQDFMVRVAWGEVWRRPGLDLRTRSCVTLATLMALGRWEELRLHLRGALNNGLTPNEISEVLMHGAIYSGFPAALSAFRIADEVIGAPNDEKER